MRKGLMVAILLLCLPMVGEGQAIRYYPDGATITPGKPTSQYIRYYPSVASSSTLLAGLVSYWNLDEESGTRVDSVGSNDLTDNNTVGFDTGVNGNAASFVALNTEYLSRSAYVLDKTNGFTIAFWINHTVASSGFWAPVSKAGDFLAGYAAAGAIGAYIYASTGDAYVAGAAITSGAWHLCLVWVDPLTHKAYVQIDNSTIAEGSYTGNLLNPENELQIGRSAQSGALVDGKMDEVVVWSRVLTEDERTELYAAGAGKFYPF